MRARARSVLARGPDILLWLGLAASLGVALWAGARLIQDDRTNALILALEAGRDLPVPPGADAESRVARILFLTDRDRLEEAEAEARILYDTADAGEGPVSAPGLVATGIYDLANARLRLALDAIRDNRIDDAATQVRLAKDGYRAALALEPAFWDAKYNLDVAMRLVREFPEIEQALDEDPPPADELLWTELPGLPRGLP